ncbi:restriction endonuclease subunit S [Geotalea sp. SG265]|uniref:restriction endonuclease subunit S n=1 Tax=Geotalea sp. SG265 TaxID=2922867 RepID=UPI001FAFF14C|nr:restriction endonuclease subunit S [Geotalea sp. SG265]
MKSELKSVASIQTGYTFRAAIQSMPSGAVSIVQMKDLTDDNRVDCSGLVRIDMEKPKAHHLVRTGDLIFRSRGFINNAAIVVDDPGGAVVAAPLFRIRITDRRVLPEYLNWYINQAPAQAHLGSHVKGTAQKMISKDALESLEVLVPSLERQMAIVELASLAELEQTLVEKLAKKRQQYIAATLLKLAEGELS